MTRFVIIMIWFLFAIKHRIYVSKQKKKKMVAQTYKYAFGGLTMVQFNNGKTTKITQITPLTLTCRIRLFHYVTKNERIGS